MNGVRPIRNLATPHATTLVEAMKLMLSQLSTDEQHEIIRQLADFVRPIQLERGGELLETIAKIIPLKREWTIQEVKGAVFESGMDVKPKEVYNAIGYLTRRGHMRRVGYGRYIVDGAEIVTSDDLGGASSRHEDGYRLDRP